MNAPDRIKLISQGLMFSLGMITGRPGGQGELRDKRLQCAECSGPVRPDWRLCPHCGNLLGARLNEEEEI